MKITHNDITLNFNDVHYCLDSADNPYVDRIINPLKLKGRNNASVIIDNGEEKVVVIGGI